MNPVIILNSVSVRYRAPEETFRTFKEYAIKLLKGNVRFREFMALNNIDLQVEQGEILGIIGRNGAGKSTLLKVISRVLIPTEGRVRIRGRVSPLLELGAGFHPELTGRENIFLNGTLLGHAPIRTYSSGMIARLGFSVATTWKPEILILDEVLSVGDEAFRHKCQQRMEQYKNEGTTTLLVTHDSKVVKSLCSRAVLLDHGQVKATGDSDEIVTLYHALL
jgi:ABC-type polysaccharide/polyol phosphate transport system ATPase subunit